MRLQRTHIVCGRPPGDGDAERVGPRHMGNTGEVFSVQTAEPLDRGLGHAEGTARSWSRWSRNDGKLTMKGFRPIAMLPTMYKVVLKSAATVGGPGYSCQARPAVLSCPWPSSP